MAGRFVGLKPADGVIVRPYTDPYGKDGGLAVMYGNLAPDGSVVKKGAVAPEMMVHEGPARVYNSEEEVSEAIFGGQIKSGDVIVIRFEGPRGGPGMREMLTPDPAPWPAWASTKQLRCSTDGRFSGASRGASVGHIAPEAAVGGPLAYVQDGDRIRVDIPARRIDLLVDAAELRQRQPATASGPQPQGCPRPL